MESDGHRLRRSTCATRRTSSVSTMSTPSAKRYKSNEDDGSSTVPHPTSFAGECGGGGGRGGGGGGDERPPKKLKPADKDPVKPGSKRDVAVWVDDNRLRLGLDTFDIAGYAEELGLSKEASEALCWPVLVSRQPKAAALAFCQNPSHKDHQGANAMAHRRPQGFDFARLCNDFCTRDKRPGGGGGAAKKKQKKK